MSTETQAPDPVDAASVANHLGAYASSGGVMDDNCRALMRAAAKLLRSEQQPACLRNAAKRALDLLTDQRWGTVPYMDSTVYEDAAKVAKSLGAALAATPAPEGAQAAALQELFEPWWEKSGQFCRAGGGGYEKTFAFYAWEAAIRAAMATPQAPAWQPIETAPKERGGLVDIICNERRYTGCHYDRICDEYRHITACGVLIRLKGATHWMPIPAAPQTKEPKA